MTTTTAAGSDQAFFEQRGFGQTLGFGRRAALIVVDLINGFTDASRPLGANLDAQVDASNQLIPLMREAGLPIIFTTTAYDDAGLADAGVWGLKMKGSATLRAGSHDVALDARLDYRAGEPILIKKYASCFFGTDLLSRLVSQGVDTVIVTGCTTSGCVRATVVDAVQNGLRPIVVREGVGDRSRASHEQSLFDLQAKYADVMALADVLAHLRVQQPA